MSGGGLHRRFPGGVGQTSLALAAAFVLIPVGGLARASDGPRLPPQASARCMLASVTAPGYCGDGGPAELAGFTAPRDVAILNGDLLIADGQNEAIRRVSGLLETISTVAGLGVVGDLPPRRPTSVAHVALWDPRGVAALADGSGSFAIADAGLRAILIVNRDGIVRTLLGAHRLGLPVDVASVDYRTLAVADATAGRVLEVDVRTGVSRVVATHLATPWQIAVDPAKPVTLIVSEAGASPLTTGGQDTVGDVVRLGPGRARTIIAGPGARGPAGALRFERVAGVAVRSDGAVLVADRHVIYAVYPTGAVERLAAGFGQAEGIAATGTQLVIADSANNRILRRPAFLTAPPIPCTGCTATNPTPATPPTVGSAGPAAPAGSPVARTHATTSAKRPRKTPHRPPPSAAQAPGALPPCVKPGPSGLQVDGVSRGVITVDFPIGGPLQVMLGHTKTGVPALKILDRTFGPDAGRQLRVPVPRNATRKSWWIQLQTRVGCVPDDIARTL